MSKEEMGYLNPDVEFEYLGDIEEIPEPTYESIPARPGLYIDPKWFMVGFAAGIGLENMCPCRPAPIEVEAEVIKTEINRPTKGLLEENNG